MSTVPGGGYVAADGTSAAAAHVTGFAALVLAHHPLFLEGSLRPRSEQRVQALFELMRISAVLRLTDPQRGGAGVPDLTRIPWRQTLTMGFSDGADRFAIPAPYWPASFQGWPTWSPPMRAEAPGPFF